MRASSPEEDLASLSALFRDGSNAPETPERVEIAKPNGVVSIAEHGSEHDGADAGKRSEDGGVGVGFIGRSLLLEPLFEELIGITAMLSNEEQLVQEQFQVLRS